MKYKIINPKRTIIFLSAVILIISGIVFGIFSLVRHWHGGSSQNQNITMLKDAAKIGQMTTRKILVQIETPKGNPKDASGRYERGDIVMVAPGDKIFSEAETSGFLIIKMDLTDKQAELLAQSLDKPTTDNQQPTTDNRQQTEKIKMRKYAIDLQKIGIAQDDQKGREIDSQTFKWNEIIIEK